MVTEKSPKKYRYSFVNRLQNYVLDALENLYLANKYSTRPTRRTYQEEAKNLLPMLDYFSGISYEVGCILFKQYELISKNIAESLMYLNKWIKSDETNKVLTE